MYIEETIDDSDNSDDEDENDFNFCGIQGHPLSCHTGKKCQSQLGILRAASVHYTVLRRILKQLYQARRNNRNITAIDKVLPTGDYKELIKLLHFDKFEKLFKIKSTNVLMPQWSCNEHMHNLGLCTCQITSSQCMMHTARRAQVRLLCFDTLVLEISLESPSILLCRWTFQGER